MIAMGNGQTNVKPENEIVFRKSVGEPQARALIKNDDKEISHNTEWEAC